MICPRCGIRKKSETNQFCRNCSPKPSPDGIGHKPFPGGGGMQHVPFSQKPTDLQAIDAGLESRCASCGEIVTSMPQAIEIAPDVWVCSADCFDEVKVDMPQKETK